MSMNASPEQNTAPAAEIFSRFADDPDMADILGFFVEDATAKIERLQRALQDQNLDEVRVFSHQLKGSAAGYGFDPLSDLARELETSASQRKSEGIERWSQQVIEYLAAIRL